MDNLQVPSYFDGDDPNLDPAKATVFEGTLDARSLYPDDAVKLLNLTGDTPSFEDLGDPYYFDKLRERVNREHLKPVDDIEED